ncbi:hypothetical protein K491DRAFT_716866 [Lophiostoma macrostomum CBS 122681]|uniref:Uncharacterized protein n=1 Tax=Lophiostoma macrostomum CBS 122681 TaxID=1314788 RepID=A0A6A6T407_9PLEO|nr:hypothetical protein K491DRAFT_716866 [Lophiostoma macrostomum CBS 122681]
MLGVDEEVNIVWYHDQKRHVVVQCGVARGTQSQRVFEDTIMLEINQLKVATVLEGLVGFGEDVGYLGIIPPQCQQVSPDCCSSSWRSRNSVSQTIAKWMLDGNSASPRPYACSLRSGPRSLTTCVFSKLNIDDMIDRDCSIGSNVCSGTR